MYNGEEKYYEIDADKEKAKEILKETRHLEKTSEYGNLAVEEILCLLLDKEGISFKKIKFNSLYMPI